MEINEGLINLDSRGTVLSTINSIRSRERIEPGFSNNRTSDFFKLWENNKCYKSKENNIMNYYVVITQFQQLSFFGPFVLSEPHLFFPSLDYFEANQKQYITAPINALLYVSKQ